MRSVAGGLRCSGHFVKGIKEVASGIRVEGCTACTRLSAEPEATGNKDAKKTAADQFHTWPRLETRSGAFYAVLDLP